MVELGVLVLVAGVILVAGVAVGMLAAPALIRWTDRHEDPGDGED
jgi:hypothetical protein